MNRLASWSALCVLPLVGLAVLLATPELDLVWENHPAHFWLVVLIGALSFALGLLLAEAAARRADARVLLIGIAFPLGALLKKFCCGSKAHGVPLMLRLVAHGAL